MPKTVATPHDSYEEMERFWSRARAICSGEYAVKDHDCLVHDECNFLIPFSPTMSQAQYDFLKREAELPGITSQFSRTLVGGLLRKKPELKLPDDAPEGALDWITNEFAADEASLYSFLDAMLWEEIQTSRPWIFVDYPELETDEFGNEIEPEDDGTYAPYPLLYKAEDVINWDVAKGQNGKDQLVLIIVRVMEKRPDSESEFHNHLVERYQVHQLRAGVYLVREFYYDSRKKKWIEDPVTKVPLFQGKPLDYIPAWPANGNIQPIQPILTTIIDKEAALYNKLARRNHLLYGAATYTPVLKSDMDEPSFRKIVNSGLGSWVQVGKEDSLDVLKTPTEALADLDRAIAAAFEELARLGVRMLSPETDQSGVALHLRNAAQNAQLGTLNTRISGVMKQIIAMMLNWRYGTDYDAKDIEFNLSDDFSQTPMGTDWVRLATEWYENGKIPRSVWLIICKQNDIIPPDYDDKEGQKEIQEEQDRFEKKEMETYSERLAIEAGAGTEQKGGEE